MKEYSEIYKLYAKYKKENSAKLSRMYQKMLNSNEGEDPD